MQKWPIFAKDFAKEWVEHLFLVMIANANAQYGWTLKFHLHWALSAIINISDTKMGGTFR